MDPTASSSPTVLNFDPNNCHFSQGTFLSFSESPPQTNSIANSSSATFSTAIVLFLALLILVPTNIALSLALVRTRRVHRNTRWLLAAAPLASGLFLFASLTKFILRSKMTVFESCYFYTFPFTPLTQPGTPLSSPPIESERRHQWLLLIYWTVIVPGNAAFALLHTLPLALVVEKTLALAMYRRYENASGTTIFLIPTICAIQILLEVIMVSLDWPFLAENVLPADLSPLSAFGHDRFGTRIQIFMDGFVLLLTTFLLYICCLISAYVEENEHKGHRIVNIRYQLRDNARTLHHCIWLALILLGWDFSLAALPSLNGFFSTQNTSRFWHWGIMLNELRNFLPVIVITLAILLGHESIRKSLVLLLPSRSNAEQQNHSHSEMLRAESVANLQPKNIVWFHSGPASLALPRAVPVVHLHPEQLPTLLISSPPPNTVVPSSSDEGCGNTAVTVSSVTASVADLETECQRQQQQHFAQLERYWATHGRTSRLSPTSKTSPATNLHI